MNHLMMAKVHGGSIDQQCYCAISHLHYINPHHITPYRVPDPEYAFGELRNKPKNRLQLLINKTCVTLTGCDTNGVTHGESGYKFF